MKVPPRAVRVEFESPYNCHVLNHLPEDKKRLQSLERTVEKLAQANPAYVTYLEQIREKLKTAI